MKQKSPSPSSPEMAAVETGSKKNDADVTATDNAAPFTLAELEKLANRYAPIVRFHPDEQYFMCTVEWYLSRGTLYGLNGFVKHTPTVADLPTGDTDDGNYWLEMTEDAKKGDLSTARTYLHAYWQPGNEYTDLQYWFCYGYNGPGTLHASNAFDSSDISLAPLGEHWIDWEQVTIRIKNKTQQVLGVFLSQHGGGEWITDLKRFERNKEQFIVYSSKNGHAVYAEPGTHASNSYDAVVMGFYLRNDTAMGGKSFDSSGKLDIVSAGFIPGLTEPRWLHFPYRYGLGSDSHITREAVDKILKAALGPIAWIMFLIGDGIIFTLAEAILPVIKFDDTNGVYGPQTQSYWTSSQIPKFNISVGYTGYTTNSTTPPCISWFNGLYHVFFQDRGGRGIMQITSPDGISWSPAKDSFFTGHTTTAGPCSIVYQGLLNVFYRDGTGNGIMHMYSADGKTWKAGNPFYIGFNCDGQPTAAVLDSKLCVAVIDKGGNGIMTGVRMSFDGPWMHKYSDYTTNHTTPPCLVTFNNQFHLFFQDRNGQGIMHITSGNGVDWSRSEAFYTGWNTSAGPASVLSGGLLYIFFRDGTGNGILYIQSSDSVKWVQAPCWYIGLNCDLEPRITGDGSGKEMCLVSIDARGNGIMRAVFKPW